LIPNFAFTDVEETNVGVLQLSFFGGGIVLTKYLMLSLRNTNSVVVAVYRWIVFVFGHGDLCVLYMALVGNGSS